MLNDRNNIFLHMYYALFFLGTSNTFLNIFCPQFFLLICTLSFSKMRARVAVLGFLVPFYFGKIEGLWEEHLPLMLLWNQQFWVLNNHACSILCCSLRTGLPCNSTHTRMSSISSSICSQPLPVMDVDHVMTMSTGLWNCIGTEGISKFKFKSRQH